MGQQETQASTSTLTWHGGWCQYNGVLGFLALDPLNTMKFGGFINQCYLGK